MNDVIEFLSKLEVSATKQDSETLLIDIDSMKQYAHKRLMNFINGRNFIYMNLVNKFNGYRFCWFQIEKGNHLLKVIKPKGKNI